NAARGVVATQLGLLRPAGDRRRLCPTIVDHDARRSSGRVGGDLQQSGLELERAELFELTLLGARGMTEPFVGVASPLRPSPRRHGLHRIRSRNHGTSSTRETYLPRDDRPTGCRYSCSREWRFRAAMFTSNAPPRKGD